MTRTRWSFLLVLAAVAGLAIVYAVNRPRDSKKPNAPTGVAATSQPASKPALDVPEGSLLIYVGTSMQQPMERIVKLYRDKTGAKITPSYGDSGEVLTQVQLSGLGEAAILHEPYLTEAEKKGWSTKKYEIAYMTPVIAVAKGNPKNVTGLRDFTRPDLRVGMTDARYTTSGQIVQQALETAGIREQVMARKPYQHKSSGHMAIQVMGTDAPPADGRAWWLVAAGAVLVVLGGIATAVWRSREKARPTAMAGIILGLVLLIGGLVGAQQGKASGGATLDAATMWDAVAGGFPDKLDIVRIEPDLLPKSFTDSDGVTYPDSRVAVGLFTLKTAKHPAETQKFIDFILSPEAQRIWKETGFNPIRATE